MIFSLLVHPGSRRIKRSGFVSWEIVFIMGIDRSAVSAAKIAQDMIIFFRSGSLENMTLSGKYIRETRKIKNKLCTWTSGRTPDNKPAITKR